MSKLAGGLLAFLSVIALTQYGSAATRDVVATDGATRETAPVGKFRVSQKADYQFLPPEHKIAPPDAGDESGFSNWLSADGYQALFDQMAAKNLYPRKVEGRSSGGVRQFRAKFVERGNLEFWTHHGISPQTFAERDNLYRSQGFRLVSRQSAQDNAGEFVQATWIKD